MELHISRTFKEEATPGVALINGVQLFTIEQPWRDNVQGHSCIPCGVYQARRYLSPTHGKTWCLHNPSLGVYATPALVPPGVLGARTVCELHSANWAEQLEGCIAFGLEGQPMFDPITHQVEPAVENSVDAVAKLFDLLGGWVEDLVVCIAAADGVLDLTSGYTFNGGSS